MARISIRRTRKCAWCEKTSRFKQKWIFSKSDWAGGVYTVCDECAKNNCKGPG